MARTIEEINNSIKASVVTNRTLAELFGIEAQDGDYVGSFDRHFSKAGVMYNLCYVFAVVVAVIENLFDRHRAEVTHQVEHQRYGYAGWYELTAKKFRFGQGISNDYSQTGSFAESDLYSDDGLEEEDIVALQPVKHAFAADMDTRGVFIKLAGESGSGDAAEIVPLTVEQLSACTEFLNRIKPAGVSLRIISEPAETLNVRLKIWVDPLVFNLNGTLIANAKERPVETAIKGYLKSIEFAGEFAAMKMVDAIQKIEGVEVVGFVSATAQSGVNSHVIEERYSPNSGYMKLATSDQLQLDYLFS
jgi:hypothetical protein